ncbi:tRNA modification GTPase GTPBP3, mitochondrial [Protopterus annectens]|uniref:tRNA modification GTPase GTPBP3, mitochondrial n=1 Tax=Protopterus annectens TaxID=7888 RepID=UPI001CFB1EF0|nr:tRNA modification GTPase GTPBP3, mitochondrial [Protopterus annectens]
MMIRQSLKIQNISKAYVTVRSATRSYCKSVKRKTIFALSSGHGKCGVSVIRVSGPDSRTVLCSLTRLKQLPRARSAVLQKIFHPSSGEMLDRGLILWFPGPNSFTGEDCCEFHVHGGPAVVSGVLEAIGSLPDLSPSEAGEFTKRAFQNGKLDLTEVEGLGDLIHAETEAQRRQALQQMAGDLKQLYQGWSTRLTKSLAYIEAYIDFSEDDNIEEGVLDEADSIVKALQAELSAHLCDSRRGERLRSGIHIVIGGATNAGKSSLLNMISQKPAAIVSPIAGTTRDVVETALNIGGYPVLLSDTAGLRESEDPIEQEGMIRARSKLQEADIVVAVIDSREVSQDLSGICDFLQKYLKQVINVDCDENQPGRRRCFILVLNKTDLLEEEIQEGLNRVICQQELPSVCLLSCKTGQGFQEFLQMLQHRITQLCGDPLMGSPSLTQARHRLHLQNCEKALEQYHHYRAVDLVVAAEQLRLALQHLGRITGKVGAEEILNIIFRDFCIGK